MITDERKAELAAMWKQTPGRGLFDCTSEELDFIRAIENRRDELRRYIAVTKGWSPEPACWSAHDRELIEQEIDAERYWPRPIPVSERLPEINKETDESEDVLAYFGEKRGWGISRMTDFNRGCDVPPEWSADYPWSGDPTHWLPTPPKPE